MSVYVTAPVACVFAEIEMRLRATGETVDPADLARVSPLAHRHIIPNGTYHFDRIS